MNPDAGAALESKIESVSDKLRAIENFVSRRFDELSMEVNAASQLFGMAEEGAARHFSEILEILRAVSFQGDGTSPANAGVELTAVLKVMEDAANKILDAADGIVTAVEKTDLAQPAAHAALTAAINAEIQNIQTACAFQDITSQRIRKTIENLEFAEDRLGATLEKLGIAPPADSGPVARPAVSAGATQDDIDRLFG